MRLIPESNQINRQNRQNREKALEALVQLQGKFKHYAENTLALEVSSQAEQRIGDLARDLWKEMQKRNAIGQRTVDMSSYLEAIQAVDMSSYREEILGIVESHSSSGTQYWR